MRLAAVVVFIVEVVLSHTPGEKSGEESAWLARTTGIKEATLRRFAHVFLFTVLSLLGAAGFGRYGIGFAAVWAVIDEVTKPLVPGRHCSDVDIFLNIVGVVAGAGLWLLVR